MSAVIRACASSSVLKNTGTNSNLFPAATAMIFVVDKSFSFTLADLNTPDIKTVFLEWIHADGTDKVYPLFGNQVPISGIANTKGTDNTVTLDNGAVIFVSYSLYSKVFSTTDGGLCFAKILKSFNNADMRVMEVDIKGNLVCKDNHDGTFGGLKATLFAPAIDMSDLKNPAKSYFQVGYMPNYFVDNAVMLQDASSLTDLIGLIDLQFVDTKAHTTAKIVVGLVDACCGDNAVDEFGADLVAMTSGIKVTNALTGVVVPSTAAVAGGNHIELTGTFIVATKYIVTAPAPSALSADDIMGISISPVTVTIP